MWKIQIPIFQQLLVDYTGLHWACMVPSSQAASKVTHLIGTDTFINKLNTTDTSCNLSSMCIVARARGHRSHLLASLSKVSYITCNITVSECCHCEHSPQDAPLHDCKINMMQAFSRILQVGAPSATCIWMQCITGFSIFISNLAFAFKQGLSGCKVITQDNLVQEYVVALCLKRCIVLKAYTHLPSL